MAYVMAALQLVGGSQTALSEEAAGLARRTENRVQAVQVERNAKQTRAYGTRASIEERKKAELVASRAKALAAASGGGLTDTNAESIIEGIKDEGEYRAMLQLYGADEEATGMEMEAAALRATGQNEYLAAKGRANATRWNSAIDALSMAYGGYDGDETAPPAKKKYGPRTSNAGAGATGRGTLPSY